MGSMMKPDVQQQKSSQDVPKWVEDAAQRDLGYKEGIINRDYQGYGGNQYAEFNPLQNSAFASANMFGNMAPAAFGNAYNALTDTTGAQMQGGVFGMLNNLAGQGMNPTSSRARLAQGDRGAIQDVAGGSFLDMDRDAYMNDYTQSVSDDVLSDMNRQSLQQRNQTAAQASAAGAFGGSRHGVNDAITQSEAQRNYGQMSNRLNQQAYDAASGLMGQDLSRGLQANLANQGMDWNVESMNTNAANQNSMFNAGQANNMQQAGMSQALNALGQMSGIGSNLANLSLMQGQALQNFGQAGMGAQGDAGNQISNADLYNKGIDRGMFEEARDWGLNNYLATGGMTPTGGYGTTQTQDVFGKSPLESAAGIAGAVGGGMMKSSMHYKYLHGELDVDLVADEILLMPLYSWDYKEEHAIKEGEAERFGPLAEDFGAVFEENSEAQEIDTQRYISALHATVQHLAKRVAQLEGKS